MCLEYRGDLQENHTLWVHRSWKNGYPSVKGGSGVGELEQGGALDQMCLGNGHGCQVECT